MEMSRFNRKLILLAWLSSSFLVAGGCAVFGDFALGVAEGVTTEVITRLFFGSGVAV